jgi:LacI family transcriptional regulator
MSKAKRVAITIAGNTYYGREAVQGMLQYRLEHADWNIHYEGSTGPVPLRRTIRALRKWKADGAILQMTEPYMANEIRKAGIPAVDIAGHFTSDLAFVGVDNEAVGRIVAEFLFENGLRTLAYCGTSRDYALYSTLRAKGFLQAAKKLGAECHLYEDTVPRTGLDWMRDLSHLQDWLRGLPKPVGVMACHDYRARDVVWACQDIDLNVPDDVAVVGVDNDSVECSMCLMGLSSVALPARQIGYHAAEMLDRMMRTGYRPPKPVLMPPVEVVVRGSSDVLAIKDDYVRQALQYIRAHAREPVRVNDVLANVPISRRLLERKFFQYLGKTPRQQILHAHVREAKRLLVETDLKVPAIATQAGFTQHQVFSRLFRAETGLTPTEYRHRFRSL